MPRVMVSAARFRSLLANRHMTVDDVVNAVALSVHPADLTSYDTDLTFDDLQALARFFKRPWSYLLIDEAEVFDTAGQDNRSLLNQRRALSPEVLDEVAAVVEMLAAAHELFPETHYETPLVRITPDTPAESAGSAIREFLRVSVDQQLACRDDFAALRLWAEALQERGVYVSQRPLYDETIRAFSRVVGDQAVVVVDTADTAYARIFSLIHEYCHVILRSAGLCDLDDHSAIERHCNAVAAATLMPTGLVSAVLNGKSFGTSPEADDNLVKNLSRELQVSQAALLIRLRELGITSQDAYDALEARRAARRKDQLKTPGGTYYPPRINRVGRRYARNVFAVLDDGVIDRQDASALLEIGEHLLKTYRGELDGNSRRSR